MSKKTSEEYDKAHLANVIYDLALASALPVNITGTNLTNAMAAINALSCLTIKMPPRELRQLQYTVKPLMLLLAIDVGHPCSAKAAFCLRTLMTSRVCISTFISEDGLNIASGIMNNQLMGAKTANFTDPSTQRSLVEHISVIYREIARHFSWELVHVGCLRHCVICLNFGDATIKTSAAGTLAMLSRDLEICKQMFTNGAIKPLLNATNANVTNAACLLSGLGCLVQLCKIPEIGVRVVKQGALAVLETALHTRSGHSIKQIREKSLYALAWLSKIRKDEVGGMMDLGTPEVLRGLRRELANGTISAKMTVLQMLLNLHSKYASELEFLDSVKEIILNYLANSLWITRNLCVKCLCILYKSDQSKFYFVQKGVFDSLFRVIDDKSEDLQEAPLVAILHLLVHREVPRIFISIGGVERIAPMLDFTNDEVRELAVIILKVICLYDSTLVLNCLNEEQQALLTTSDGDPVLYGGEYGGMIEDYLQQIVENRRDEHYLLEIFEDQEEIDAMGVSETKLVSYQNTFMELDLNCAGILRIDELKMLMVMMGEEFDEEELQEILEKNCTDGSNALNFKEFVLMMENWSTQFGTGLTKVYNELVERGPIAKARRDFMRWWNRSKTDKAEIQAIKEKKSREKEEIRLLADEHFEHEKLKHERATIMQLRRQGTIGVVNKPVNENIVEAIVNTDFD